MFNSCVYVFLLLVCMLVIWFGWYYGFSLFVCIRVLLLDWLLLKGLISELCFLVGFGCCGFVLALLV